MSNESAKLLFERLAIEQALSVRAAEDPEFRQALRDDPVRALKEIMGGGAELGAIEIDVVEADANRLRVTLPPEGSEGELSDDDLDAVAGGRARAGRGFASLNRSSMMHEMAQMNAQFLALQGSIQQQSKLFQSISSVMKASHDAAKQSIRNLRS